MADGDGATVDVEFAAVEIYLAFDADKLRTEGFVDFEAVDGIEWEADAFEKFADGGGWSNAHDFRGHAYSGDGGNARERLDIARFSVRTGGDQGSGGAVHDGGTVAAGLHAAECGAGFGEDLVGRGADVRVGGKGFNFAEELDAAGVVAVELELFGDQRSDFAGEEAAFLCG